MDGKVCTSCLLPPSGEGGHPFLLPDGWGWADARSGEDYIVCPTCVRLGFPVDEVATAGVN